MKLLLTSSGISNGSIRDALVRLLGKPIEESTALVVPMAILPFDVGPEMAARLVRGETSRPMADLPWKSIGLLELSALPSISRDVWLPTVAATDALLVWGGDPVYLAAWLRRSGLGALLPSLRAVYVGTSAGSIVVASTFVETFHGPLTHDGEVVASEEVVLGENKRTLVTAHGAGLVDFTVIPHFNNPDFPDALPDSARIWAERMQGATYALDDQSALAVDDGLVEVVSEGRWELFA